MDFEQTDKEISFLIQEDFAATAPSLTLLQEPVMSSPEGIALRFLKEAVPIVWFCPLSTMLHF